MADPNNKKKLKKTDVERLENTSSVLPTGGAETIDATEASPVCICVECSQCSECSDTSTTCSPECSSCSECSDCSSCSDCSIAVTMGGNVLKKLNANTDSNSS